MNLLLRGLAFFLILGALFAAFLGYRLSQGEPDTKTPILAEQPAPKPLEVQVVQAVRHVPAGQAVTAEDIKLVPLTTAPKGSYKQTQLLVGKVPSIDIAPDEILISQHFKLDNPLLRGLHAGERAMAIKVDEVAGLVGFVKPGDRVDVLLYLHAVQETDQVTSAQVVLRNARLLAYGEDAGEFKDEAAEADDDSKSQMDLQDGASKAKEKAKEKVVESQQNKQPRKHSSAVLAIPEQSVSRLMLAASSGSLRLVLRPLLDPLPSEDKVASQEGSGADLQRLAMLERKEIADRVQFETLSSLARVRRIKDTENQKVQYVPVPVAVPMAAAASVPAPSQAPESTTQKPEPASEPAPTAPVSEPPAPAPEPLLDVIIHEGEAVRHLSVPSL